MYEISLGFDYDLLPIDVVQDEKVFEKTVPIPSSSGAMKNFGMGFTKALGSISKSAPPRVTKPFLEWDRDILKVDFRCDFLMPSVHDVVSRLFGGVETESERV